MTTERIAIIGAGIAGLSCARVLADAGLAPVVFDKGRGVGGRLATRRADGGLHFDHGAPYLTATDPGFAALLGRAEADGALARWQGPLRVSDAGMTAYVGLPGMSGFARYLGSGLDVRTGATVSAVSREGAGWRVTVDDTVHGFDRVVMTMPAPQVLRLLGPTHALSARLAEVQMAPCLTLMAAFGGDAGAFQGRDASDAMDWIGLENTKPGRDQRIQTWVVQAGADFSRRYLEEDMLAVAQRLLPMLCARIGRNPTEALHSVAHRWRFSRVEKPLGQPYLTDPSNSLHVGGDWSLGPLAQDGWRSGRAIAEDILR